MEIKKIYVRVVTLLFLWQSVTVAEFSSHYFFNPTKNSVRILFVADSSEDAGYLFGALQSHEELNIQLPIFSAIEARLDFNRPIVKLLQFDVSKFISRIVECLTNNQHASELHLIDLKKIKLDEFERYLINETRLDKENDNSQLKNILLQLKSGVNKDFSDIVNLILNDLLTNKNSAFSKLFESYSHGGIPKFLISGIQSEAQNLLSLPCHVLVSKLSQNTLQQIVNLLNKEKFFLNYDIMQILWFLENMHAPQNSLSLIEAKHFEDVSKSLGVLGYQEIDIQDIDIIQNSQLIDTLRSLDFILNGTRSDVSMTYSTDTSFDSQSYDDSMDVDCQQTDPLFDILKD